MKKLFLLCSIVASLTSLGQEKLTDLEKVLRVNFVSPGIEYELPIMAQSTIAANAGIGIQGSYLNLSSTGSGYTYFIAPFLDLSYKKFYNRKKRDGKGKSLAGNAGNYWGMRMLTNFKEFKSQNINRYDEIDFAFGPTWGIQRSFENGSFHYLFSLGPVYYFDTEGNNGFFPVMVQFNLGFNLSNK